MTEPNSPASTPARRLRRRFPLTLCALAGSAIAVPLYLTTMSAEEAGIDASAAADAPSLQAKPEANRGAERPTETSVVSKAREEIAEAEPMAAADAPASPPPARKKAAMAPAADSVPGHAPPHGGDGGAFGGEAKGGLGLIGTGRGGAGMGAGRAVDKIARDEGAMAEADMRGPADADDDAAQQQVAAGQLTAGAIDDRTSTKLLDELRTKATSLDAQLGRALPSHKATGAAPSRDHVAPVLEIGLVLDTTGSMGDEIQYLKAEIRSIAQEIAAEHPGVTQRYALVAYRDQGDEYVVRGHGFEPLDAFVNHLSLEYAGGGGDLPEAMDEAMDAAGDLQWSSGDAARLLFLVADAPPHTSGYSKYVSATGSLAAKDVSVYPVASSGVEPICEYLMRWAARTTGGQYLFLTDHSGIGNAHADPHVEQYELKSLRAHMLDVIRDELGAGEGAAGPVASQQCFYSPSTWWERHGLLLAALGGVFLLGFAGDMAMATMRRRRQRS
jgi:hypothetical protein